jgi:endonuclease/exonuclease/phosphatase family metal-dependent hydrolase
MVDGGGVEVLSINIWAIPYISLHTPARLHALFAYAASQRSLTVLCLQECWVFPPLARRLVAAGFPHIAHHPSGAQLPFGARGSGLVIASRAPIVARAFHAFAARGSSLGAVQEGDAWAGKGIQLARLRLDGGGTVDVYNIHFCAAYGASDAYGAARAAQALEAANFITATRRSASVIVCGDLNGGPAALAPRLLGGLCGLADAHGDGAPTCNVRSSVFKKAGEPAAKLDYILYAGAVAPARPGCVLFAEPTVPVPGPTPLVNMSDHCGVACAFERAATAPVPQQPPPPPDAALLVEAAGALAAGVARCRATARARLRDAALVWAAAAAAAGLALRSAGGGGVGAPAAAALLAAALLVLGCALAAGAVETGCFEATALEAAACAVVELQRAPADGGWGGR